jgi:prefoldin beta subunit
MEVPRQIQDKINQFQTLQNQLQAVMMQKQQMTLQSADIDSALTALEKAGKPKVYEAVGPILIETTKEDSEKKLKENKELMTTRVVMLEKQEKKLTEKLKELSTEIQSELRGGTQDAG